jgi:hypothetical protein
MHLKSFIIRTLTTASILAAAEGTIAQTSVEKHGRIRV